MVNLVTVDGQTFLVDVGFGSNGPVHPILLESGSIISNIAPRRARLDFKKLAQHTNPSQRAWVYSSQENPDAEWKEMYSFVEIEFFPEDFMVMNLSTMSRPQSYFVKTVLAMRTLLNTETGETEGVMILHGDYIKRKIGDQSEILERLESEEQRVQALAKYFQIFLKAEEQKAIRGLATELKSTPGP
ncbi:putative tpa: arylamine n-acetyltransferase 1 protein [Phaeoacremonium minimum UCRPA7]|uniref:Putative tpa: arylamine n-acetyltransferase 1 protein n=1 Tax=Phaeoacremonium minimum (strain UCR-PA7) TaxID=1286976 RepID=R8BD19_PHAM7|nr:putative tpa: arylamine n-acetyltransferase 1 protein [Phaeoacremonium minimum UCRPA7]EON97204.1 putative tpa: arylamine n-acetyltransferase 1 protein [Phaeoacremonium minimum UCRPA7]